MVQEMASGGSADTEFGEGRARRADAAGGEGVLCVKVMTDEQVEVLRRQIAAYANICEQLMEMHRVFTAHQDSLAGTRLGSLYSDSMVTPGGHRITPRQRWSPTTKQLQMLENIFDQGNGTPSKQTIKEITVELSQHGQISETNVYNWFQNRRARSKRKQMAQSNPESEAEVDCESPSEKKPKMDSFTHETQRIKVDNHSIYNAQVLLLGPEVNQTHSMYRPSESSKSSGISDEMYYEKFLPSRKADQWREKMDGPAGSFSTFHSGKNYEMIG